MSENIYSNLVSSASFAHAGFAIDWGNGPGGVQPGLGHRVNVMGLGNASYREVGIGVSERSADDAAKYGKLAVTQDYGLQIESPFFLLGVAYQDQNENGAYDPGEGLPGIKVRPSVGEVFAITSASGGYAIPFQQSPGAASVVFSGEILPAPVTKEFSLVRENVKVDLRTGSSTITLKMQAIDKTAGETKASGGSALLSIVRGGLREELKVIVKRPVTKKTGIGTPNDYTIAAVKPARSGGTSNKDGTFVVLLPKGQSHADIKISAIKDEKIEGTEKVPFWLVKSPKYKLSKTDSATISIKD
ncbi:MAG: hypothetical protein EOP84_15575 [Verrucomicrobiaceae bacterium]|nr:MAG: hypothetical protein EOP84_15575 [Verrucomicrobiaceae bacterium]